MAPETPRGVSSRLLSMKFMQRAVASGSSAGSPDNASPSSSKKRKLDHSPSTPNSLNIDQEAVQAAIDERESKRQSALKHHSAQDTHWVLGNPLETNGTQPESKRRRIVYVGYGDIDSVDELGENEDLPQVGRTSTKRAKGSTIKAPPDDERPESDDRSNEDSADESDQSWPDPTKTYADDTSITPSSKPSSRSNSRSRQRAESTRAKEFREKRKKKEVKLNKLTSLSSGGGSQFGAQGSPSAKSMECYNCHQVGHRAVDCPQRGSRGPTKRS